VFARFPKTVDKIRCVVAIAAASILVTAITAMAQTPVATITSLVGQVGIERGGNPLSPSVGAYLDQGDRITTGSDGRISLVFTDHSEMEIGESTVSTIDEHGAGPTGAVRTRIGLLSGVVRSMGRPFDRKCHGRSRRLCGTNPERGKRRSRYQV
jgi:hypothetical protein